MAANKYLALASGIIKEVVATIVSAGVANANQIVALGSNGLLDLSVMPVGIGPDTATITASENLAAGAIVNLWNNTGTTNARNADNTVAGKEAWGFVLAAVTSGQNALVYFGGEITGLSGLTPASTYFLGTTGAATSTSPSTTGNISQSVGIAESATELAFFRGPPITIA